MLLQSLNYCSCAFNYACHSLFTRTHKCIIQCAESLPFIDTNYSLGGALAFYVTIHEWVAAGAEGSSGRPVAPRTAWKTTLMSLRLSSALSGVSRARKRCQQHGRKTCPLGVFHNRLDSCPSPQRALRQIQGWRRMWLLPSASLPS